MAAYVFTAKYFNGDYFDFAKEAASCVITLSLCLKKNENFPDFETAVKSVEQEIINVSDLLFFKKKTVFMFLFFSLIGF